MSRVSTTVTLSLTIISIIAGNHIGFAQQTEAERVEQTIQSGVRYLLGRQLDDGSWKDVTGFRLGSTGLCTLALLNAGMNPDSPELSKALAALDGEQLYTTYAVGLQTMAFCMANPNRYAAQIEQNASWLAEQQLSNGGWTYGTRDKGFTHSPSGDPSNSQFALLALHEAQRSGNTNFTTQKWNDIFTKSATYWKALQNNDGGFWYNSSQKHGRGSMTAAGIASLVIVGAQLGTTEATVQDDIQCCGSENDDTRNRIAMGFDWLDKHFSVTRNPVFKRDYLYYMYALERAGRLTGKRFIGKHDWYREGANQLVRIQNATTGKIRPGGSQTSGDDATETAFSLLFLAKGKRQIVVSRLQYGRTEDWNHHAAATGNLTAHTEQAWKRDLAWQNIDLERSQLKDLLDTPVLFISGTQRPNFSPPQKAMLKEYVEQGGFIFAEGCNGNGCDGKPFEDYFKSLVQELFDAPLTKLPPEHPIWYAESRVTPHDLPSDTWLYGVETCCRLGVVYCPTSLSCRWELNPAYGARPQYSDRVNAELENFTKIGLNVLAYATGKELKEKLDLVTILEDQLPRTVSQRNTLFVPVLQHNAGADDAAQATTKLLQWLGKQKPDIQLSSEKRLINISTSELERYPVVYMHGRGKLRLSTIQREALKNFLENGGFIFASAICADEEFTQSFRDEMQSILPTPLTQLSDQHRLLTEAFGGFDIRRVKVIDPDTSGESIVTTTRSISPRLEVGRVNQRISVIFSPLDISCALESRHSLQCKGYIRQDAARIGINSILFAFLQD